MKYIFTKKTYIFILLLIIVAITSFGVVYTFRLLNSSSDSSPDTSETRASLLTEAQQIATENAREASEIAYSEGDSKKAVDSLDKSIQSTGDSSQKAIYLNKKAEILYNSGDIDGAYTAAVDATEADQDAYGLHAFAGQMAREKGDRDVAIRHYEEAIRLMPKDEPLADEDTAYYRSIIEDLKAGR